MQRRESDRVASRGGSGVGGRGASAGAPGSGDERAARYRAVAEGFQHFVRELQAGDRPQAAQAAGMQRQAIGSTGVEDVANNANDDAAVVQAVEASMAAAAARRRAARMLGGAGGGAAVGAGDGDAASTLGTAGGVPHLGSSPRVPISRAGSASVRGCGWLSADWRERIPAAPAFGRAPAYPEKPERGRFSLPSPANQREGPRSLVEWFMTKVYDPVKVNERAQKLAENRERRKMQHQLARPSSSDGDDSSSERPGSAMTTTTEATVVAGEGAAAGVGDWLWAVSQSECTSPDPDLLSHPSTSTLAESSLSPSRLHSSGQKSSAQQPILIDQWQLVGQECSGYSIEQASTEMVMVEAEGAPGGTGGRLLQRAFTSCMAPPPPPPSPQSALVRNRAHVLGSSLQLGSETPTTPRFRSHVQPSALDNFGGITGIAGMGFGGMSAAVEATAAGPAVGAVGTAGAAAAAIDDAAFERRRIRQKMMGGGRPDWLNDGTATKEWGARSGPLRAPPPAVPPQAAAHTGHAMIPSADVPMMMGSQYPVDHVLVNTSGTPMYLVMGALSGAPEAGDCPLASSLPPNSPHPSPRPLSRPTALQPCTPPSKSDSHLALATNVLPHQTKKEDTLALEAECAAPVEPESVGEGRAKTQREESKEEKGGECQMEDEEDTDRPSSSGSTEKPKRRRRRKPNSQSSQDSVKVTAKISSASANNAVSSRSQRTFSAKTAVLRRAKTTLLPSSGGGASPRAEAGAGEGVSESKSATGAVKRMAARMKDLRLAADGDSDSGAATEPKTRIASARRASSGALPLSLALGRSLAEARPGSGVGKEKAAGAGAQARSSVSRLLSAARRTARVTSAVKVASAQQLSPKCSPVASTRVIGGGGGGTSGSEPRPLTREATFSLPDSADGNALSRRRT